MSYAAVSQAQFAYWALMGGAVATLMTLLYLLAFKDQTVLWPEEEMPEENSEEEEFHPPRAVPWFLMLLWGGIIVWAIGHTIFIAVTKPSM